MFNSKCLRNAVSVGLLVLLFLATGLQAQSSAGDQLLKMIPAESLFCLRVNNFEYTLSQIDQFLAGVSPMPMGLSILARTQLAKVLGSPELNGVNMNGSFVIFGAIPPGEPTQTNPISELFIGGLVPVTDYRQLISGNPNCSQSDEKGISKITSNGTPIMLLTQTGNYALISWANDYDKLLVMAKEMSATKAAGLASTLDATEAKLAMTEPIWAYGNVQQASKTFGNVVSGKIEEFKTNMKNIKTKDPNTPPMMNIDNIANLYVSIFQTLMKETSSVSLTIRPKPTALNLKVGVSAVSGTDMANMFDADTSANQKNKLLGYLEDGAMMNFGFKINSSFWKQLNIKSIDLLAVTAGESMTTKDIARMKALAADVIDCVGGPIACSASIDIKTKPPFVAKYVTAVKDKEKFNRLIDEAMQMMNTSGIMDFYKDMGIETSFTIQRGVDRYKDVSIDSAKFTMKSTDANSPQGQMINAMYGGGFDYRWGMVDGLWVCTIGSNANSAIRELIDQVKAGGPKQMGDEMKAALTLLPEADKADFVVTYNFLRLFKMMTAMVPVPIPQMDFPTKSNIVFAGKAGNGKMVVDIALPKEHLNEIMAVFQMMQQQQQKQMMQQRQQKKPNSPRSRGINSISPEETIWVKCQNPDCKAAYQMGKRAYFKYIEEHADPMSPSAPALVCKKCGKESIYRAEKCEKCGLIFLRGTVPNDFADRCPKCGNSKTEERRKQRAHSLAMSGRRLTAEEVESIEKRIEKNPRDIISRTKLLGYYFGKQYQNQSAREAKRKHVLWLILNSPESEVLATPYGELNAILDTEAYSQGKKAWINQLKRRPANLKLLEHSANFFLLHDRELAVESLQTARSLDMDNPKWPTKLGRLYSLDMIRKSLKVKTNAAGKALEQFEIAYKLSTDRGRDVLLQYLAKVALAANKPQKAKEYAEKMLSQNSSGWNYGNNIHHGNIILGRIALTLDDLEEAKKRLINAGKTPGSPQLNSFGPNMTLAKELLQKGEKDVVLKYLELCSKFWKMGKDRLHKWSVVVKDGKIPDFGRSLNR